MIAATRFGPRKDVAAVILAAGKGTRMRSDLVKVLHPLAGRPMLAYVLDLAHSFRPQRLAVVIGHQAEAVRDAFQNNAPTWTWVVQKEQKGTAHAVSTAGRAFKGFKGTLLILYGDVPLLRRATVKNLLNTHWRTQALISILTATVKDPTGYGRIVRGPDNGIRGIVEETDASPSERSICEINTGIYCMELPFLFQVLPKIRPDNAQGEYYLTDVVAYCADKGVRIGWHETQEPERALGINTRKDLAFAEATLRADICERWMLAGVTIVDPSCTSIDFSVRIGKDTRIGPCCQILGRTSIGRACSIAPHCCLIDATVGDRVTVGASSVLERTHIGAGAVIEPLTYVVSDARRARLKG